ncbi:hypothetical protein [Actinomadura sp. WMMA1423]|uniref:hypothetical protein n=1 Tax=Actinomadura sp. WMMA1423 TaxID=2591108 RepID=UPI0011461DC8|nr:hypothetical protein [Actinomadura sp. WMMA1423]
MGFFHAVVAVRDLPVEEVASRTGRRLGGRTTDYDTASSSRTPGWCVSPPIDGWTFVVDKRCALPHDEGVLARLSAGTRLLTFEVVETSMGFAAACWTDGRMTWEAALEEDGGLLYTIGDPPPPFDELVEIESEGAKAADHLDFCLAPPSEEWEDFGFDPQTLPGRRAAKLNLPIRVVRPVDGSNYEEPIIKVFAGLTGHRYNAADALHRAPLHVLSED